MYNSNLNYYFSCNVEQDPSVTHLFFANCSKDWVTSHVKGCGGLWNWFCGPRYCSKEEQQGCYWQQCKAPSSGISCWWGRVWWGSWRGRHHRLVIGDLTPTFFSFSCGILPCCERLSPPFALPFLELFSWISEIPDLIFCEAAFLSWTYLCPFLVTFLSAS